MSKKRAQILTDLQIMFFATINEHPEYKKVDSIIPTASAVQTLEGTGIMNGMQFGAMLSTLGKRGLVVATVQDVSEKDSKGRNITKGVKVFSLTPKGADVMDIVHKISKVKSVDDARKLLIDNATKNKIREAVAAETGMEYTVKEEKVAAPKVAPAPSPKVKPEAKKEVSKGPKKPAQKPVPAPTAPKPTPKAAIIKKPTIIKPV